MANTLDYFINLDAKQAQTALSSFQSQLSSALSGGSGGGAQDPFTGVQAGANRASGSLGGLAGSFMSLRGVIAGVVAGELAQFAKSAVDTAGRAEAAFKGLESVANRTGVGIEKSWSAVIELTADGVLSTEQAATALKNLFARGFDLEQSIQLINSFKDAAAFGRQSTLAWGEAVTTATEGLRNENSALVDNAGVTKNVAKMWEEYAKAKGISYDELTLQQKREAEYNGVLAETTAQVGDAKKAMEGMQGTNARLAKSWTDLKTTLGSGLSPAYQAAGDGLAGLTEKTNQLLKSLGKIEEIGNPFRFIADGAVAAMQGGAEVKPDFLTRFTTLANRRIQPALASLGSGGAMEGLPPLPPSLSARKGIPPLPPATIARGSIPSLDTNKTGIPVIPQPGGPTAATAKVQDNIDAAQVAADKKKRADAEAQALAKQQLAKSQKQLQLSKAASDDELAIFKSGLDAQKAALAASLAKNPQMRQEYARQSAALEQQELAKVEELRVRRAGELQKQLALATKSGDKDKIAEAQQALNAELAQGQVNANKLKQLQLDAGREVLAATQQNAAERRRMDEQLLAARQAAEKTAATAVQEREQAALQASFDQRLITEDAFLRQSAALKDKALALELSHIQQARALLAKQNATDPAQAAADKAKGLELAAQEAAIAQKRQQATLETDSKLALSAKQLAQLRQDLDNQLLEAEGKNFEARSAMIDTWLAEKRAELAQFPELLAKAGAVAAAQKKGNRFDEAQAGISALNDGYDAQQQELQNRSQRGLLTDIELDRQSLALKREQADALRERLDLLRQNANGSEASAQAIAGVESQIAQLDAAFSTTAAGINETFFSSIEQGFKDLASGAKEPMDVLRSVVTNTLSSIADMLLKSALQSMFASSMGGAGGGLGGAVMSFFGGFRAAGGDTAAGTAYVVGEKGPELWFSGANGKVVSNADIQRALSAPVSRQMMSPSASMPRPGEVAAGQALTVQNNVTPRVVVTTSEMRDALMQDPGFSRDVVDIVMKHGRRIQSNW